MKNSLSTKNHKKRIYFTSDNQTKKYKITREFLPNLNLNVKNQIPININIAREDLIKKEIGVLDQIWDELEITYQYRKAFSIYLYNMNEENKNNIIVQEKNNLKKYKKALINLKKEISIREDNILLLKRYNNRLDNFNNDDQVTNIIDEVINLVKKLRKNAINIIKEYSVIETISKNYSNLSNTNKKIIKSEYSYDPNYIYKMQDDLLFLKESTLSKYFEMDNKFIDPFLTNFCTTSKDDNKKTVANSNDILELINESRYVLFQKKIFDKINNQNSIHRDINRDLNIETSLKILSRNFSTKNNRKIEYKKNNEKKEVKEVKLEKYLNQLKLNCPNKYTQLFFIKKNSLCNLTNINSIKKQINVSHKDIKPLINVSSNINLITKIKEENNELKKKMKNLIQNINIKYYTGDIDSLLKTLEEKIPLDKIPKIIKTIFKLNESIYKKEFYLKGVFPKILILNNEEGKDKENVIGLCFFYYEWKEEPKYLKLKVDYIISNDNNSYEKHIEKIINYIKINIIYERIEIELISEESTNNLLAFFQNELKFNWLNVQKDKKSEYKLITLYYEKKEQKELSDIFTLSNKSILCLDNKEQTKNENENSSKNDDNYINKNNIYYMLSENKSAKLECLDESKFKEITDIKNKISDFSAVEINHKIKEDNDIKKILDQNALKEINDNGILYKMDLNLNFDNCFSTVINNIYYNKITSEEMQVYREENTNNIFYLIPTANAPFSLNICEINQEVKNILTNNTNNKSIYDIILEFTTNSKINLLEQTKKCLYIPAFLLKKKLFSKNFEEIEKNIKISDESNNSPLYLSSFTEFINVKFKPDINIKNNFIDGENKENDNDCIIKNDFIIGILRNEMIKDNKLDVIQILYIEKCHFLTKDNYKQ